ncbi:hypothetical protein N9C36_04725 [Candidatus Pelagibacter sp.]|nr:hypothetical protein [Candidatus Pelagibacter sp.]
MLKIISSTIIFLLFQIQISLSQEFYPNKELDLEKFINFDLTNYNFNNFDKIIGNDVQNWDGDSNQLTSREKDWKKIDIKINNKNYKLKLSHQINDNISLTITTQDLLCDQSRNLIPEKYIKTKNLIDYKSDFQILKMRTLKFSYDTNKNTRLNYTCLGSLTSDDKPGDSKPLSVIYLGSQDKTDLAAIIPLKMISCQLLQGKTYDSQYSKIMEPHFMTFYISDGQRDFLDDAFISTGQNKLSFNKDLIHTVRENEYDKTKTNRSIFYFEHKVDRINGVFYHKRKIYDKTYTNFPNNIAVVEWTGQCKKKDIEERVF